MEKVFGIVQFPPVQPDLFATCIGMTRLPDEGIFPWWILSEGCWFRNSRPDEQPPQEIREEARKALKLANPPDALMLDYLLWYAREYANVARHIKPDALNMPETKWAATAIRDALPAVERLQEALKTIRPELENVRIALKALEELPPPARDLLGKEFLKYAALPERAGELRENIRPGVPFQQYAAYLNEMSAAYFAYEGNGGILDRLKCVVGILDIAESLECTAEKWGLADGLKAACAILSGRADSVRLRQEADGRPSMGTAELVDGFGRTALAILGKVPTQGRLNELLKVFLRDPESPDRYKSAVKRWCAAANTET